MKNKIITLLLFHSFCLSAYHNQEKKDTVELLATGLSLNEYIFYDNCLLQKDYSVNDQFELYAIRYVDILKKREIFYKIKKDENKNIYYTQIWGEEGSDFPYYLYSVGTFKDSIETIYSLWDNTHRYHNLEFDQKEPFGCYVFESTDIETYPKSNIQFNSKGTLFDRNFKTAWIGKKVDSKNIIISIKMGHNALAIANGHFKDKKTWKEYSRIKLAKLFINENFIGFLKFEDIPSLQFLQLNDFEDYHIYESRRAKYSIEIIDIYPGTETTDVAISEILALE